MEAEGLKISKTLKAEIYECISNELKQRGFGAEACMIIKNKKSKIQRSIKNLKNFKLKELHSGDDKICYASINEEEILPEEIEYRLVYNEAAILRHLEASSLPKIIFVIGMEHCELISTISKYRSPLIACVWLNPQSRPILLRLLSEIEAKHIVNSVTKVFEQKFKIQDKRIKTLERSNENMKEYFPKLEFHMNQIQQEICELRRENQKLLGFYKTQKEANKVQEEFVNNQEVLNKRHEEITESFQESINYIYSAISETTTSDKLI